MANDSAAGAQVATTTATDSAQVATTTTAQQAASTATAQVANPSGDDVLTPEQLRDALTKARAEAAKNRIDAKRFKELEDAETARKQANLSEQEKLAQRAEQAEAAAQKARSRIGASELKLAAQAAGIIDPDVAAALLGARVEYDDDGEPKNVSKLVDELKASKPHLFGASNGQPRAQSSGGATNPGRAAGNAGLSLEAIQAMSMKERIARFDEIDAWEKAQRTNRR